MENPVALYIDASLQISTNLIWLITVVLWWIKALLFLWDWSLLGWLHPHLQGTRTHSSEYFHSGPIYKHVMCSNWEIQKEIHNQMMQDNFYEALNGLTVTVLNRKSCTVVRSCRKNVRNFEKERKLHYKLREGFIWEFENNNINRLYYYT